MLFFKNIIALKNLDTTVKCHFGRISNTEMFFIRENHIFHTGLHLPDNDIGYTTLPGMRFCWIWVSCFIDRDTIISICSCTGTI